MEPNNLSDIIMEIIGSLADSSGHGVSETSQAELEKALAAAKKIKPEDYGRIEEIIGGINISELEDHLIEILNLHIQLGRIGIWNAGFKTASYDFIYSADQT